MATIRSPDSISADKAHGPVSPSEPVKLDVESQNSSAKHEATPSSDTAASGETTSLEDNSNVPHLSIPRLFWFFFYNFGLFAWGGPVAQIALIKDRLVIQEKWITLARFQRVFSVYQILPGPEAAELCMFFGCLSAGRLGGIVAGLAFILPGFALMLLASYIYSLAGFDNKYFNASFRALQPIVAAMVREHGAVDTCKNILLTNSQILRATHKIADHSVMNQKTRKVDPFLVIAAICTAINGALRINM
jgi:chromate transport protein ChrA